MTIRAIRNLAAAAALLTAAVGGQALAQDYHGGYGGYGGYGDHSGYGDRDGGRSNWGGGYGRGDLDSRIERVQRQLQYETRSGRLNQWEVRRAWQTLSSIRQDARYAGRDGGWRERAQLGARLDRLVAYIHQSGSSYDGRWRDSRY